MRAHVRIQLGAVVTSVVMLLGMIGAAAPAYSAPNAGPNDCKPAKTCPPPGGGAEPPAQDPGPGTPTTEDGTEPEEPPEPEPDTEAPSAPLLGLPTVAPEGVIELSVTAEEDARLVLEDDELGVVAQAVATGAPQVLTWTATDGEHTYSVTVTDKAKNESEPATVTVDVDATPPPVRRFVARSGTGTDSRSHVTIRTAPDTAFVLLVDDEVVQEGTTSSDGAITQTLDLADGRHRVGVELSDEVGNLTTRTKRLVVRIPELAVEAELASEVTDDVQVIRVEAEAAATGVVTVPGTADKPFRLDDGAAQVELTLADGSYEDPTVTVRDPHGRTGTVALEDIVVDTTAPLLSIDADHRAADQGKLSVQVDAEDSTVVSWRLLGTGGAVVASGKYVAVGADQPIARDVEEGSYELEVTATDTYGRTTVRSVSTRIAADPMSTSTKVLAALGVLVLVVAAVAGIIVGWRRRRAATAERRSARTGRSRRARARVAATEREEESAHEQAHAVWAHRHDVLTKLLDVAHGGALEDVPPVVEAALLPEETVLYTIPARLTEMVGSERADVPVEVDRGHLLVTSQRFAFVGEQQERDWWHALVERVAHIDHRHTMIELWDSESRSGMEYDEPEVTRLYIDLAMSAQNGTRAAYVAGLTQGLRDHEMRRPTPPPSLVAH